MRIKLKLYRIYAFMMMLCLLNLPSLEHIWGGQLSLPNDVLRVVSALIVFVCYNVRRKRMASMFMLLIVIMQGWLFLSTAVNGGSIWNYATQTVSMIAFVLLFESMRGRTKDFIFGIMPLAELICYANLATVLFAPGGLYLGASEAYSWSTWANWLLGNKNNFVPYLLIFCIVAFFYRSYGGNAIREWGIYIASFVSVLLARSSASMVGFALLPLGFLVIRHSRIRFNGYVLLGINAALFSAFILFRLQNLAAFLIEGILNKSLSFTGRVELWDSVMQLIREKPILGYGIREAGYLNRMVGKSYGMHAHNLILQQLYEGGVVMLLLYLGMLLAIYRHLRRVQYTQIAQCVTVTLFLFQVMALMEPYKNPIVYIIYAFGYYIQDFALAAQEPFERARGKGAHHRRKFRLRLANPEIARERLHKDGGEHAGGHRGAAGHRLSGAPHGT